MEKCDKRVDVCIVFALIVVESVEVRGVAAKMGLDGTVYQSNLG
jgi:hypothetical protein